MEGSDPQTFRYAENLDLAVTLNDVINVHAIAFPSGHTVAVIGNHGAPLNTYFDISVNASTSTWLYNEGHLKRLNITAPILVYPAWTRHGTWSLGMQKNANIWSQTVTAERNESLAPPPSLTQWL